MSKYTITLKRISEVYDVETILSWFTDYDLTDYLTTAQINEITSAGIWTKDKLAQMIFEHYYLREIAFETPEMFRHYTKVKMQEIMGSYLPIIYSNSFSYNPLLNETFSETETFEKTKEDERSSTINGTSQASGTNTSTSSSTGSGLNVNSDTPQGQISKQDILAGSYASSTQASESTNSIQDSTSNQTSGSSQNTESTTNEGTESYERNKSGFDLKMTKADLIANYRKNIYNVNEKIIEELNSLFFALY